MPPAPGQNCFMKTILFALLLSSVAQAQLAAPPESFRPLPEAPTFRKGEDQEDPVEVPEPLSETMAVDLRNLAGILGEQHRQFTELARQTAPACDSAGAADYTIALQLTGQYDDCASFARRCGASAKTPIVALRGGLCQVAQFQYAAADPLLNLATSASFAVHVDFNEAVLSHASTALYGIHADQVDAILARNPRWNADDRRLWKALLQRYGSIQRNGVSDAEINQFLERQIASTQGGFRSLLQSLRVGFLRMEEKYDEAMKTLIREAPAFRHPLLWSDLSYQVFYAGLKSNFASARWLYDATLPYLHPFSTLPTEFNTYNYTELENSVCRTRLLQASESAEFKSLKRSFQKGELSPVQGLTAIQVLMQKYPQKADLLTTYGGFLSMNDRRPEAIAAFWQAHQLCPYYNRAHWGLLLEKRYLKYSHLPDSAANLARLEREIAGRPLPPSAATYFVNWNSLSTTAQKRIQFGARIWLPYLDALIRQSKRTYIKASFELLSESPELSHVRDLRITYSPYDHRLWDDVRGLGGEMVVADLNEVMQTYQGDYNLLGHEMAHQFQYLSAEIAPAVFSCIVKLYAEAKAQGNFPESYSALNKEEHFAQGVTYFLIPSDVPPRFGFTQAWLTQFNPRQWRFIQSIDQARGNLAGIGCD